VTPPYGGEKRRPDRIVGTGHQQEATPHRQLLAAAELERLAEYHQRARTHLWLVLLTHKATDAMLDGYDDPADMPILDVDSMVGLPALVCYICETAYQPRLRHRRCPGEPS
jgi:hypothetical protein